MKSADKNKAKIDPFLLSVIVCPACKGSLNLRKNILICSKCRRMYELKDNTPFLIVKK